MESVLIAAGAENARKTLADLIRPIGAQIVHTARSGRETRQMLAEHPYDLVIVNAPLPDESGMELAIHVCGGLSGAILLVKSDLYPAAERAESYGALVLSKPLNRGAFLRCVRLSEIQLNRLGALQRENRQLKDKIEEIRLTDRAKCLLIEFERLSETEAHRYIEKRAMDLRAPKITVAREIVRRYENR